MGSNVLVVKRNRRRLFASLWAAPAWLRGVVVGARGLLDAGEGAEKGEASSASSRGARLEREALLERETSLQVPALIRDAAGGHACTGCQRCVAVCPSDCLHVEGAAESLGGTGVERLTLQVPRCIGCGDCVSVCPESALRSESLGAGFRALASGDARLGRELLSSIAEGNS